MKKNLFVFFSLTVMYVLFFISCATFSSRHMVLGIVVDENNNPLSDVRIFNSDRETCFSDNNGHFCLKSFSEELRFSKKGYVFSADTIYRTSSDHFFYIKLYSENYILKLIHKSVLEGNYETAHKLADSLYRQNINQNLALFLKACIYKKQQNYPELSKIIPRLMINPEYSEAVLLLKEGIYDFDE